MTDLKSRVLTLYSRFFPSFFVLEHTLKTGIFEVIQKELGEEWFLTQLDDSVNDPLFKAEITLILHRKPRHFTLTPQLLRDESGLGLWVEFFNPRIYKLSKGRPIKIFRHMPKEIKRVDLYRQLVRVKEFRNRLMHSRFPLIATQPDLRYLDEVEAVYSILLQLTGWLGEMPITGLDQFRLECLAIRSLLMNQ